MATFPYSTGVIHGRFQVLHNDHLKYLMAGKAVCRHLVVGVTRPDPFLSRAEEEDPKRNLEKENPLTYFERFRLVNAVLRSRGLSPDDFSVVPFPINFPELYRYYVPMDAVFLLSIYDEWGRKKLGYFQEQGLKTHVLWEVPLEEKGISAHEVRDRMKNNMPWTHLVPREAAVLLNEWRIPERIRTISNQ